eukprot:jgi/Ulvmu1/11184/UM072_0020.1
MSWCGRGASSRVAVLAAAMAACALLTPAHAADLDAPPGAAAVGPTPAPAPPEAYVPDPYAYLDEAYDEDSYAGDIGYGFPPEYFDYLEQDLPPNCNEDQFYEYYEGPLWPGGRPSPPPQRAAGPAPAPAPHPCYDAAQRRRQAWQRPATPPVATARPAVAARPSVDEETDDALTIPAVHADSACDTRAAIAVAAAALGGLLL